jgi:hypothetical protein
MQITGPWSNESENMRQKPQSVFTFYKFFRWFWDIGELFVAWLLFVVLQRWRLTWGLHTCSTDWAHPQSCSDDSNAGYRLRTLVYTCDFFGITNSDYVTSLFFLHILTKILQRTFPHGLFGYSNVQFVQKRQKLDSHLLPIIKAKSRTVSATNADE